MTELKIVRIPNEHGELTALPDYQSLGAAAMDLHAFCKKAMTIGKNGGRAMVPTGIAIELPSAEYAAFIMARSSLGAKYGVCPSNAVGLIDSDYRGEIFVALTNHGTEDFVVNSGDRVAQLCVLPVERCHVVECAALSDTQRGTGGFGSTGKK